MARLPRLSLPGLPHLALQRGLAGVPIFRDDSDRQAYLDALREALGARDVALHGYALLDDAVWLLGTPTTARAWSLLMQAVGRRYVAGYNRRHGRSGTLWDGRFRSTLVEPALLVTQALPFVELTPVRAGLASEPGTWRWSSAPHHLGRARDSLVTPWAGYWALGNTPFERELHWSRRLDEGLSAPAVEQLEAAVTKGWPLGGGAFLAQLAGGADRPVQPRPRGRPKKVPVAP